MEIKDLYEELCNYYVFMLGGVPDKENFKKVLQATVSTDDLEIFFLMPFSGPITLQELEEKCQEAHISSRQLDASLKKLAREAFIMSYEKPQGRTFERGNPVFTSEQQVRKSQDTPERLGFANFFNAVIEGVTPPLPSTTPYYRVLPVERSIKQDASLVTIQLDIPVPDPRAVLPLDIVTEMVKKEKVIGIAECFCRKTKTILHEACQQPLETCFVFNELAETLIDNGFARPIEQAEAFKILANCERSGLVHNVDNCEGDIRSLCNCCSDCCVLFKTIKRGGTNASGPARFLAVFGQDGCDSCDACMAICPVDAIRHADSEMEIVQEKCVGCGLCVSACPKGSLKMVPRSDYATIYATNPELWGQIGKEAIAALTGNKGE
jgi:Pyruvate/2-oxoacid:ferredoxin oxidoreductase delta subunit